MTSYVPLPRLRRSWLNVPNRPSATVALPWAAPGFGERQPPTTSVPMSIKSDSASDTFCELPVYTEPVQLPPVVLEAVGRSTVPQLLVEPEPEQVNKDVPAPLL